MDWGSLALGGLGALTSAGSAGSMGKASRHALKRTQRYNVANYSRLLSD